MGVATLAIGAALLAAIVHSDEPELSTRLSITVDEPMLTKGGAVIVAARPVSDSEWHSLQESGGNANPLTKEFRIRVSSPASVVELVYPESGTYSFKLEPIFDQVRLATREIRVGSAVVTGPETKQRVDWRSMSIIHVGGTVYDEGWARVLSSTFDLAFESSDEGAVSVQRFAAGRILSLSEDAIETFVQDSESDR